MGAVTKRLLVLALVLAGCAPQREGGAGDGSASHVDLGAGDGGATMTCYTNSADQEGCICTPLVTRACFPRSFDPNVRDVGVCRDGTQTCAGTGEFSGFDACVGAITPTAEDCGDGLDNNCDGTVDCADPSCAVDPTCNTGCSDGQMRACYTGPTGTLGVGTCAGGMQVCVGGQWPSTCDGEMKPQAENCADAMDHDCNHLPGCLDFFSCLLSPACQATCKPAMVDPMCVCPTGSGDTATCPNGMFGVNKGGTLTTPGMDECCPCTSSDCGNAGCCGEAVCAGSAKCAGLVCKPLPASCNNQVNADCDDFPEDCDEPCCKCTSCP